MNHLLEYLSQNLHATLNTSVWALSLVLQGTLFVLLFSRGIARRFPFFTSLIGFYILRSAVLFLIFNHVSPSNYSGLRDLLLLPAVVENQTHDFTFLGRQGFDGVVEAGPEFEIVLALLGGTRGIETAAFEVSGLAADSLTAGHPA